jgi:formylglycine-generating enzyme
MTRSRAALGRHGALLLLAILPATARADSAAPPKRPAPKAERSGFDMVFVKGGSFSMGGHDGVDDGGPPGSADECPHPVIVRDFSIGRYEVTRADWLAVFGGDPGRFGGDLHVPVDQVSWDDAQEFIRRLNAARGTAYRLPTEEEWEFAARGGRRSRGYRYAGSADPDRVAWYERNAGGRAHAVGTLRPNELGLYDMSGNAWEWCSDFEVPYPCDPIARGFGCRVLRGGTWLSDADAARVRDRNGRAPYHRLQATGFRLAR